MLIGILQTGDIPDQLHSRFGNYNDMFVRLLGQHNSDFEFAVHRVLDLQFPDSASDCDGWLITGSRFGAYEAHPWIPGLMTLIRKIVAAEIPLVGICFGHQIIAQALGGRVEKSKKGWGVGLDTYTLNAHSPFGDRKNIKLNVFHQDQVVELPPGAEVFASSDLCQYAGLHIGDKVLTLQAHPEFTNEFIRQLLTVRKGLLPDAIEERALRQLKRNDARVNSELVGQHLSDFFRAKVKQAATKPYAC